MQIINIQMNTPHFNSAALPITPIMQLIADFPEVRPILDSYGLDTCCGGHMIIPDACREHGIDADEVLQAVGDVLAPATQETPQVRP